MSYERLCSIGKRVPPFSSLASQRSNHDLERAIKFLQPIMKVNMIDVYATAYLFSFLSVILTLPVILLLNISLLIGFPIVLGIGLLTYYVIMSYPVNMMNSYRVELSEESDLIFEQFLLVFHSGGSIFDAIEMGAQSNHPYLSKAFKEMIADIENGVPPETCISEFSKNQPSEDLRRYFTGILAAMERKTELLDLLSGESFEADLALRQKNLEIESRLLIVTALSTYIPIIVTLAISLSGAATNPIILLFLPIFILLSILMSRRFAHQFSAYFDRPRETEIVGPSQNEIIAEYDAFLNFLMAIGERLRHGDTLEVALTEVREDMTYEVQRLIDPAIDAIYSQERSLQEAMEIAANIALGQRVSHMFKVITLMVESSAVDAGARLTKIAGRLIKRSAIVRERDSIIAAQRMKVYILVITSSLVLGLMTSLAPYLGIAMLFGGGSFIPGSINLIDLLPLLTTMIVTSGSNGYLNTRMVGGKRPAVMGLLCTILFWISFALASSVLGLASQ